MLPLNTQGKWLSENVDSLHIGVAILQLEDLFVEAVMQRHDRNAVNPLCVAHCVETPRAD